MDYTDKIDDILSKVYADPKWSTRKEFIELVYTACYMEGIPVTMMDYADEQIQEMMDYE